MSKTHRFKLTESLNGDWRVKYPPDGDEHDYLYLCGKGVHRYFGVPHKLVPDNRRDGVLTISTDWIADAQKFEMSDEQLWWHGDEVEVESGVWFALRELFPDADSVYIKLEV